MAKVLPFRKSGSRSGTSSVRDVEPPLGERLQRANYDLVPVGVFVWIASVARVVLAILDREIFTTEPTLALVCIILLPCLLLQKWTSTEPVWGAGPHPLAERVARARALRKSRRRAA